MIGKLVLLVIIFSLNACGVPKYTAVTPELRTQFVEDLKAGNKNLTGQTIEGDFSWIENFHQMVSFYDSGQWERLAVLVMQVGQEKDIAIMIQQNCITVERQVAGAVDWIWLACCHSESEPLRKP